MRSSSSQSSRVIPCPGPTGPAGPAGPGGPVAPCWSASARSRTGPNPASGTVSFDAGGGGGGGRRHGVAEVSGDSWGAREMLLPPLLPPLLLLRRRRPRTEMPPVMETAAGAGALAVVVIVAATAALSESGASRVTVGAVDRAATAAARPAAPAPPENEHGAAGYAPEVDAPPCSGQCGPPAGEGCAPYPGSLGSLHLCPPKDCEDGKDGCPCWSPPWSARPSSMGSDCVRGWTGFGGVGLPTEWPLRGTLSRRSMAAAGRLREEDASTIGSPDGFCGIKYQYKSRTCSM